ncbi:transposase [Nodularia spumigena]|uniref:transposase n=1 Tax=Nodularia spumigena TaxID=70799 RepID=UPI003969D100
MTWLLRIGGIAAKRTHAPYGHPPAPTLLTHPATEFPRQNRAHTHHFAGPLTSRFSTSLPSAPRLAPFRARLPRTSPPITIAAPDSETYGDQEGSAYNGHFECECCHPLFCFNQFGDVERALLRNGKNAVR